MNVQNTEAWNVFRERSEQGVSAVHGSLGPRRPWPPSRRLRARVARALNEVAKLVLLSSVDSVKVPHEHVVHMFCCWVFWTIKEFNK